MYWHLLHHFPPYYWNTKEGSYIAAAIITYSYLYPSDSDGNMVDILKLKVWYLRITVHHFNLFQHQASLI